MSEKYKLRKGRVLGIIFITLLVIGFYYKGDILKTFEKKEVSNVLVYINGIPITEKEIETQFNKLPTEYKNVISKDELLEQIITETLILEKVTDKTVDESRLKQYFDQVTGSTGVTKEQLESTLITQGSSLAELTETFKKQILINDFLNKSIFSKVKINEDEIKKYYENNNLNALEGQARVSHILVQNEDEAKEIFKLITPENFHEIAIEKSIGPSKSNGGKLGIVQKGQLVKEFEEALFKLKENEISKPVKTQFGWHLIFRQTNKVSLSEVHDQIQSLLFIEKQKTEFELFVKNLRKEAKITYNKEEIEGCLKDSTLYVVNNCKYCDLQLKEIDNSKVKIINCNENDCNIKGYPTWKINEQLHPGYKTKEELKKLASC